MANDGGVGSADPPALARPAARRASAIRLSTADEIRVEMAKVYRDAKRGTIPTQDATRLVYILGELRKAHETMVLEAQLIKLEKAYGQFDSGTRAAPGRAGAIALPGPGARVD